MKSKINSTKKLLELTFKQENSLYNYQSQFRYYLNKLDDIKDTDFLDFMWFMRKKNISIKRLINLNQIYFKFLLEHRNIKKISERDFELIYTLVYNSNLSNMSKITYLKGIKQIMKYFKLQKKINLNEYKIKDEKKIILYSDLLTEKEKLFIISNIKKNQHKVFFTILFDTGLRVGEVYSIDKNCFQKVKTGYFVTIQASKTQIRTVFTYSNNDLIEKLLNSSWTSWTFGYRTSYNIIKRFEKKLNKRLYHHLARHTKATELSKDLTEQELKNYMGWTPDSDMLNNYIHLNNKDILNKMEKIYGI